MTDETKAIVHEAIDEYIKKAQHECRFDILPDEHSRHHAFVAGVISSLDKIDGIKWEFLKDFIKWIARFAAIGVMFWLTTKLGWDKLGEILK